MLKSHKEREANQFLCLHTPFYVPSAGNPPAGQEAPLPPPTPQSCTDRLAKNRSGFSYKVPWNSLPKDVLDTLKDNEDKKIRARQETIDTLKMAIVVKLISAYQAFKDSHPGSQKHPGLAISQSVTDQVTQVVKKIQLMFTQNSYQI